MRRGGRITRNHVFFFVGVVGLVGLAALIGSSPRQPTPRAAAPAMPVEPAQAAPRLGSVAPGGVPTLPVLRRAQLSSHAPSVIAGVVRDSLGRAVEGAEVLLFEVTRPQVDNTDKGGIVRPTNAEGRFVIEVGPGDYLIYARHQGRASAALAPISLQPAERLDEVELQLSGRSEVRGIVVDDHGDPVEATVYVAMRATGQPRVSAFGHLDGSFACDGLPDEPLVVEATAHGLRGQIELAHPERDVIIRVRPIFGELRVEVRDEHGVPVPEASVTLSSDSGGTATSTDADGVALFHPSARRVRLRASVEGAATEPLALELDQQARTVVLSLAHTGSVTGRILLPDGSPATGFAQLVRADSVSLATLDDEGGYQFSHVRNGRYELSYTDEEEGYLPGGLSFELSRPEPMVLADLRLAAAEVRTVRGRVLDERGAPIAEATVEVHGQNGLRQTEASTDKDGRFSLELSGAVSGLRGVSEVGDSPITPLGADEVTLVVHPIGFVQGVLRAAGPDAQVRCSEGVWHEVSDSGQYFLRCPLGSELEVRSGDEVHRYPLDLEEDEQTYAEVRW